MPNVLLIWTRIAVQCSYHWNLMIIYMFKLTNNFKYVENDTKGIPVFF